MRDGEAGRMTFPTEWEKLAPEWDKATQTESKQIAGHIMRQIVTHSTLKAHDELPSDEALIEDMGATPHTARRARELLAENGVAEEIDGRYFVACPACAAERPAGDE